MLKVAFISGCAGFGSAPKSLLVRDSLYHGPANGAPVKSRKMPIAPAEPRTAEVAVQVCAAHCARIVMVMGLSMVAPHLLAAAWKALSRCWPSVVPLLPPTGEAAVVSLKPTPAASLFKITIVAVAKALEDAPSMTTAKNRESNRGRIILVILILRSLA